MNDKEDSILLAQIEDRMRRCEKQYMMTMTNFLDLRQRTMAEGYCRKRGGPRYAFYGGYADAERCMAVFFPDYAEISVSGAGVVGEGEALRYFQENAEDNPLAVIRAKASVGQKKLSHRDYLGSLTGLGLKREMIGDILVREDGADILIFREIGDFLLFHYDKAGRTSLELTQIPLGELIVQSGMREEKGDTVASLRLDNVIASVFSLSRGKAAEAIRGGIVFVNGLQIQKPDAEVNQGDRLVLRGKGKALLKEVGGQTRKDRIFVRFDRYL